MPLQFVWSEIRTWQDTSQGWGWSEPQDVRLFPSVVGSWPTCYIGEASLVEGTLSTDIQAHRRTDEWVEIDGEEHRIYIKVWGGARRAVPEKDLRRLAGVQ